MTAADRSALLRDALTPGSSDATIRKYLALAPDPERILDAEERDELAADTAEQIKVAILTLAPAYREPPGPEREDEDAAFWADVEKWSQQ